MAVQMPEIETEFVQMGPKRFSAVIRGSERSIEHEFYLCPAGVVQISVYNGPQGPQAVFRRRLSDEKMPKGGEISEKLRKIALDGAKLQIQGEFDVSVEVFEENPV